MEDDTGGEERSNPDVAEDVDVAVPLVVIEGQVGHFSELEDGRVGHEDIYGP